MSSSASPGGEMATRSSDRPMRERIVAAAIQVIRERGVTRATTKEIARAAKVSEGSIYNHFENKTALFGAAFGAVTSGIRGAMRELAASVGKGTVEGNLERLAGAAVRFYGELLPMTASALADHQVSAWLRQRMPERGGGPVQGHAALIAYLEAERAAGRVGPAADPAFIAATLLGACLQHAFLSLLADPAALDPPARHGGLSGYHLQGASTVVPVPGLICAAPPPDQISGLSLPRAVPI